MRDPNPVEHPRAAATATMPAASDPDDHRSSSFGRVTQALIKVFHRRDRPSQAPKPSTEAKKTARERLRLAPRTPDNVRAKPGLFSGTRGQSVLVDRFGEVLPYVAYDPDTHLFALESDEAGKYEGLGYVVEVSPQIGADLQLANAMLNIISANCPPKTGLQISLFGSPRIDRYLHRMVDCTIDPSSRRGQVFPEQYSVLRRMAQQRAEYYRRGCMEGLHPHSNHRIRHFRGYFSVVYPTRNPFDKQVIREVMTLRESHISTLQQYQLYAFTWSIEDLMWYASCVLNPHTTLRGDTSVSEYDPFIEPRFQLISPDTRLDVEETRIDFSTREDKSDAMSAVCMSVRSFPSRFNLQGMSDLLGSMTNTSITYPCPYTLTLGVEVPDYEVQKNRTLVKAASAQRSADLDISKFMPDTHDINRDWKMAQRAFSEGKGTVRMYLQLVLYAPPDQVNKVEEVARSVWRLANFELTNDLKMQQQALLSSLPMMNGPILSADLSRARRSSTKTAFNASNMCPLIAEWTGTPEREGERSFTPLLTLIGRRGQIMSIDPFANRAGNPNMAIVGASGSGKSFLCNEMVHRVLATGGRVWIIDVGFSYVKLCETLGGQYIEFNEATSPRINIFDLVRDPNKDLEEIVKPIIAQMCSLERKLGALELAQLGLHIQSVYDDARLAGRTPTITDVAHSLINNCELGGPNPRANDPEWRNAVRQMSIEERAAVCDPRIRDLGVQLLPFSVDGPMGKYFNGTTNIRFTSNFIVLELEQLKANPHLQAVILMTLMQLISYEVYQGDPSIKKLVLLDEAWALMKAGDSAAFIEEMYRRIRKAGGACATATQSIADYDTPTARAALQNADCVFLLRQKKDSIEALVQSKKIVLDAPDLALLRSVTKSDDYSEAYVKIGDSPGVVGRLIVDPYSILVYSTSPNDKADIKRFRDQGLSLADAIDAVLVERGITTVSSVRMLAVEEAL